MEGLNLYLFNLINASANTPEWLIDFARFWAIYAILLVPALLVIGWLRRSEEQHRSMLCALIACAMALVINNIITALWYHPRPFVMPVGHTFIPHEPDASFPSDHMTIVMTMAISLLLMRETRRIGVGVVLVGLFIGWSRVFLGVHFPMDMAGGVLVAFFSSLVAVSLRRFYMRPLYRLARGIHRRVFAFFIKRGWMSH